ncbi:hypothetical protein MASR2M48_07270 [Spirochaetota bacterium]
MSLQRLVACALIFVSIATSAVAQAASLADAKAVSALPEPYTQDEFPAWLRSVRRFEIISLGAFPILLFYTRLTMDVTRYTKNNFNSMCSWPFRNENSYVPSDDEQYTSLLVAAGLSLIFGSIDAFMLWKISIE